MIAVMAGLLDALLRWSPCATGRAAACALLLVGAAWTALAASEPAGDPEQPEPAVVVVWNREIAIFRSGWHGLDVRQRAVLATHRITEALGASRAPQLHVAAGDFDGERRHLFYADASFLFGLGPADLAGGPAAGTDATLARLQELFAARTQQFAPSGILRALAWSAGATLLAMGLAWCLLILLRRLVGRINRAALALPAIGRLNLRPLEPFVRMMMRGLVLLPVWAAMLGIGVAWLDFVLACFPYTAPLAHRIDSWLLDTGAQALHACMGAVPGLLMVGLIAVLTRMLLHGTDAFFGGIESRSLSVSWLQPETAKAMRRIATILIWLFALIIAYPYLPGSSSEAFKGVSVFAGLLLTLGSAGVVSQVMSGLVVVFSRTMKPGDMIQVNDLQGQVRDLGLLSTKIVSRDGHEVTIPNALLVGNLVHNHSNFDPGRGPMIAASVSIGYDTPWRQVHDLLRHAAELAEGVDHSKPVEIVQTALSDWYVCYEARCAVERVEERQLVQSRFHAMILDCFHTAGVQIMSPNYVGQPDRPVLPPSSGPVAQPRPAPPQG